MVGGMSFPDYSSSSGTGGGGGSSGGDIGISGIGTAGRRAQHVHCLDLHRDLKIVSSHTLVRDNHHSSSSYSGGSKGRGRGGGGSGVSSSNSSEAASTLCVTDMASNRSRNNIVVGCSDGTLRVLDGNRRNAEVAKARAQPGGVAKVAVSENLIAATGYSTRGLSTPSSPLPYPFPSPHVLVYDVRYLGRGGIPHATMLSASHRGGPRFVRFLEGSSKEELLVGSGQTFGGMEVIVPFGDAAASSNAGGIVGGGLNNANDNAFFQPELNAGESMTTVDIYGGNDGESLYIGTSYGRVLQYGLNAGPKTVHRPGNRQTNDGGGGGMRNVPGSPNRTMGVGTSSPYSPSRIIGGNSGSSFSVPVNTEPLDMPPFVPAPPAVSIDPAILLSKNDTPSSSSRSPPSANSSSENATIRGWNVVGSYALASPPLLSSDGGATLHPRYSRSSVRGGSTLGPLGTRPMVPPSKRWLSKRLQERLAAESSSSSSAGGASDGRGSVGGHAGGAPAGDADFVKVFPTSNLELDDLLEPDEEESTAVTTKRGSGGSNYRGDNKSEEKVNKARRTFPNPNKFLYSSASFAACYDATANPRRRATTTSTSTSSQYHDPEHHPHHTGEEDLISNEEHGIPLRYRLTVRPPFYKVSNFDYAAYNQTGLWVGWDYAPSFTNSFACSVLALLYFVTEVRETALRLQLRGEEMMLRQTQKVGGRETSVSITAELGLLFHLMETLSANGMIQPTSEGKKQQRGQVKAFVPSNFISAFALLPEATNLALVDGVAGSAEIARRPEAFYRFLMQYMERELGQLASCSPGEQAPRGNDVNQGQLIDRLQGIDFLSIIEYARGKPKISTSRAFTVDLAYDQKLSGGKTPSSANIVRFGQILRFSLCKEAPLRAWCEETRSYEAVVQRKIATSLPSLLSLSCCCAGRRADTHGLQFWQQEESRNFLPEFLEIQIETDKSISVKELAINEQGEEEWMTFKQKLPLKTAFFDAWEGKEKLPQNLPIKKSYRLDAVVSFIRTDTDESADDGSHSCEGHHVVHVRANKGSMALAKQLHQIEKCLAERNGDHKFSGDDKDASSDTAANKQLTLVSGISLEDRLQQIQEQLRKVEEKEGARDDQWLLLNGFVVTKVDDSDDVRSFNAKFKEPSIVLFREIEGTGSRGNGTLASEPSNDLTIAPAGTLLQETMVPDSVMGTTSISNSCGPKFPLSDLMNLPSKGDLVAIDAEFVCVQAEESSITYSGQKEITSEPRNALARLSVINCQTNDVIIDDYVLPREPVVDYLTRFSGIRQNDLNPNSSPHHLVTPLEAYLKVRLLMERGCIFVGHGLSQDFRVINICIPPNQIIDTAEIFHQPNQRYISLRYLTNYVMGKDMQQEVHDSIEDARASYELFTTAVRLKKEGRFDDYLMQLYAHGHKTQFKLGVAHDK